MIRTDGAATNSKLRIMINRCGIRGMMASPGRRVVASGKPTLPARERPAAVLARCVSHEFAAAMPACYSDSGGRKAAYSNGCHTLPAGARATMMRTILTVGLLFAFAASLSAEETAKYDVILRGGTIYDGTGAAGECR